MNRLFFIVFSTYLLLNVVTGLILKTQIVEIAIYRNTVFLLIAILIIFYSRPWLRTAFGLPFLLYILGLFVLI